MATGWADWITAGGTAGAALAAAVGAWQAARAAKATNRTADDAREALALALTPDIVASGFKRYATREAPLAWGVKAENVSAFGAADVEVTVHTVDGVARSDRSPHLRGAAFENGQVASGGMISVLMPGAYPEGPYGWTSALSHVVVTFSDDRRLARWERRFASPGEGRQIELHEEHRL